MNDQCPFCWGNELRHVGGDDGSVTNLPTRRLLRCEACEKWFWEDTAQEIPALFPICETAILRPGRCFEEIRELLNSGGMGFPRRRAAEFNQLCSACPNRKFAQFISQPPRPKLPLGIYR
jgi:hypothetical protein